MSLDIILADLPRQAGPLLGVGRAEGFALLALLLVPPLGQQGDAAAGGLGLLRLVKESAEPGPTVDGPLNVNRAGLADVKVMERFPRPVPVGVDDS